MVVSRCVSSQSLPSLIFEWLVKGTATLMDTPNFMCFLSVQFCSIISYILVMAISTISIGEIYASHCDLQVWNHSQNILVLHDRMTPDHRTAFSFLELGPSSASVYERRDMSERTTASETFLRRMAEDPFNCEILVVGSTDAYILISERYNVTMKRPSLRYSLPFASIHDQSLQFGDYRAKFYFELKRKLCEDGEGFGKEGQLFVDYQKITEHFSICFILLQYYLIARKQRPIMFCVAVVLFVFIASVTFGIVRGGKVEMAKESGWVQLNVYCTFLLFIVMSNLPMGICLAPSITFLCGINAIYYSVVFMFVLSWTVSEFVLL